MKQLGVLSRQAEIRRATGASSVSARSDALESTSEALRPNGIIVSVVRVPDEAYLQSKGVRAAYFIVDVTRDRLDRISA